MKILDKLKNSFLYSDKYKTHSEAVIIACYFNPQNNPYRLKAFNIFYDSIKHLNHRIVECVIGDSKPQLEESQYITRIQTKNLLWHKESLLNNLVSKLPTNFKYVFWLDADVIFTNNDWLVDSVEKMENGANMVQPFEYCVHLEQDQLKPNFSMEYEKPVISDPKRRHPKMWKSFGANHVLGISGNDNYDVHGHVGFAWGAKRSILDAVPLYDRALVGGADHIIAHAAAGQFNHSCIKKSFTEDLKDIEEWSKQFYYLVRGRISYANGNLYHIWHGDIAKREYLKRVQEFTPMAKNITNKDENGLHVGIDFVGYVFFHTHTYLRKSIKKEFARMMARRRNWQSYSAYNGWLMHCNGNHLRKKLLYPWWKFN